MPTKSQSQKESRRSQYGDMLCLLQSKSQASAALTIGNIALFPRSPDHSVAVIVQRRQRKIRKSSRGFSQFGISESSYAKSANGARLHCAANLTRFFEMSY